jgi:hypothetical protein
MAELDWMEYNPYDGYDAIPEHTHDALIRYFVHGIEPGGFLTAMLAGQLFVAAFAADFTNKSQMRNVATWIVHHAPHNSYGTSDIVKKWCSDSTVRAEFDKKVVWHKLNTAYLPKVYD